MRLLATAVLVGMAAWLLAGLCNGAESTVRLQQKVFKDLDESQSIGFARMSAAVASPGTPPESIEWPPFGSEKPLFGRINLSGESAPAERAYVSFALDQSSAAQTAYDHLYIDVDRDGKLADTERITGQASKEAELIAGPGTMDFGVVEIPAPGPGRPTLYLRLWSATHRGEDGSTISVIQYSPWSYFEGAAEIGGAKQTVRLFDGDMDGSVAGYGVDVMAVGEGTAMPLSRVIQHDEELLSVRVAEDGKSMTLAPYTGPKGRLGVSVVKDGGERCEVSTSLTGGAGTVLALSVSEGESIEVPAGDYTMPYASVECQSGKWIWVTCFFDYKVSVPADKNLMVRLGKPMSLEIALEGDPQPGKTAIIGCGVRGVGGEVYDSFVGYGAEEDGQESSGAAIVIKDQSGKVIKDDTIGPGGGQLRYQWTVPEQASPGDTYSIEITVDTGPFAGKITASKAVTVVPATKE
jgi:hypothetical protein